MGTWKGRRVVMMAIAAVTLLVIGAGCDDGSSPEPDAHGTTTGPTAESTPPLTPEELQSVVLTLDDLPPGWSTIPYRRAMPGTVAVSSLAPRCPGGAPIESADAHEAAANSFSNGGASLGQSLVTATDAATHFEATKASWQSCVGQTWEVDLGLELDEPMPIEEVTLSEIPAPEIGDAAAAYRADYSDPSSTFTVYTILVVTGPVVATYDGSDITASFEDFGVDASSPLDAAELARHAAVGTAKIERLLAGEEPASAVVPSFPSLVDHPDAQFVGTIAYVRHEGNDGWCVVAVDASGRPRKDLLCGSATDGTGFPMAWWSADGTIVVDDSDARTAQVIDVETGTVVERPALTPEERQFPRTDDRNPDGTVVERSPDGSTVDITGSGGDCAVVVARPDGASTTVLGAAGPSDYCFADASWAPDGRWILVMDSLHRTILVTPDGSSVGLLARDDVRDFTHPLAISSASLLDE